MTDNEPIPSVEQEHSKPDLDALLTNYQTIIDEESKRKGFKESAVDWLKREKIKVGTAAVLSGPFFFGLAQGLNPQEALVYGVMQIITIGAANSPDTKMAHDITDAILQGNMQELGSSIQPLLAAMQDSFKEVLKDAGVISILTNIIYRRVNSEKIRLEDIEKGITSISPQGETMFILGGQGSNIVNGLDSLGLTGKFLPIFESDSGASNLLVRRASNIKKGEAQYLNLEVKGERTGLSYLQTPAWNRLKVNESNLIHAEGGEKYLLVVGCGEQEEDELSLNPSDIDVSQDDLKSAGIRIRQQFTNAVIDDKQVVEVYVGNASIQRVDREDLGKTVSDRALAKAAGVDIYLDAWSLCLEALSHKLTPTDGETTARVRLITSNPDYQALFKEQFSHYAPITLEEQGSTTPDAALLVHENTTSETYLAARQMRHLYPDKRIIALLSSGDIEGIAESCAMDNIDFVSASDVIGKTLIVIQNALKIGKQPSEIQGMIDAFAPPLPVNGTNKPLPSSS